MGLNSFSFRFLWCITLFSFLTYLLLLFPSFSLFFPLPSRLDLLEPIQTKPSRLSRFFFCIYLYTHTFFQALSLSFTHFIGPRPRPDPDHLSALSLSLTLSFPPPFSLLHSTLSSLVGCSSFLPGSLAPPSPVTLS